MRNAYQLSKPRSAPTEEVDKKLHAVGLKIESLSKSMATLSAGQRERRQLALNKLVERQGGLKFERQEIITKFFYR